MARIFFRSLGSGCTSPLMRASRRVEDIPDVGRQGQLHEVHLPVSILPHGSPLIRGAAIPAEAHASNQVKMEQFFAELTSMECMIAMAVDSSPLGI